MKIKDYNINCYLEIILITYNRDNYLEKTLKQLLNSPLKNCLITVIDNASIDRTKEIVNGHAWVNTNIKLISNKKNIGGGANIVRAYEICGKRKYALILCDDDIIDFNNIEEIYKYLEKDNDIIMVCNNIANESKGHLKLFKQITFLPSVIFKTELITDDVIQNMYDNTVYLFSNFPLITYAFNNKKKIVWTKHNFVFRCDNPDNYANSKNISGYYLRGRKNVHPYRKYMSWFIGFINVIQDINNNKIRQEIIDEYLLNIGNHNIFNGILYELNLNKEYYGNSLHNILDMFCTFNIKKRILLILGYIFLQLQKIYSINNTVEGFYNYLLKKNAYNKFINFCLKYRTKKILLYGGGLYAEALFKIIEENKFNFNILDNILIADYKFPKDTSTDFHGIKGINSSKIKEYNPDIILIITYQKDRMKQYLNSLGIDTEVHSLIKKSILEKLFSVRV